MFLINKKYLNGLVKNDVINNFRNIYKSTINLLEQQQIQEVPHPQPQPPNRHHHQQFQKYNLKNINIQEFIKNIENTINSRKCSINLTLIKDLLIKYNQDNPTEQQQRNCYQLLLNELNKLPNQTHPDVQTYGDEPKIVKSYGDKHEFNYKPKDFYQLCKQYNILRTEHLGNLTGSKSYYFNGDLAEMEQALILYTTNRLSREKFQLISVPDILPIQTVENCGMETMGERNQVYRVHDSGTIDTKCLSGTSEMAMAGYFENKCYSDMLLPIKLQAVSRCFRAETSGLHEEKGIFRVHYFTKVEMFAICQPDQSNELLDEFISIQIELFKDLGLHFKLLDMPACELGRPAYRKYDIEAWMPGRNIYGEISSCSNCTDYQSKRLNIQLSNSQYAHTINGTACALPRMLIAIFENFQRSDGTIEIPEVLQKYMNGKKVIEKSKYPLPDLRFTKSLS